MLNLLRYLYYGQRFPQFRDYVDMGLGIASRRKRAKSYWNKHCQCSKDFQCRALEQISALNNIAVLGAGRLFDIDTKLIAKHFKQVDLFDADPSCEAIWRKDKDLNQALVNARICEVTSSIVGWTKILKAKLNSTNAIEVLNSLEVHPFELDRMFDCIFSINLLSQIPVYWRDRATSILDKVIEPKRDDAGHYPEDLEQALTRTYRKLQNQHLTLLAASKARTIVLITDTEWYYYKTELSPWQIETALYVPTPLVLNGYEQFAHDSWLWHIAPYGSENTEYGEIHKVEAFAFRKSN